MATDCGIPINQIIDGDCLEVLRVFPRRTRATPDDANVVIGHGPGIFTPPERVEVSVTFSWDLPLAQRLAEEWSRVAPTRIGGPATGMAGGNFDPGRYLKRGYVITSRGCPNRCWFCSVWRREGSTVRELPVRDGWNVLDDNLLACSDNHIRAVFAMLRRQKEPVEFTGGLEAARLQDWHVDLLAGLKPKQMFFAYDTPDDYEPLVLAGRKLLNVFTMESHSLRAYVLIGYPKDTFDAAEKRLRECYAAGFLPMAMLWRDGNGETYCDWRRFQKSWARAASVNRLCRGVVETAVPHREAKAGQRYLFESAPYVSSVGSYEQ